MKRDCISSAPVRRVAMKVATRSNRLGDCSTSGNAECASEASLQGTAHQTSCTLTDTPHQNVHQPMLPVGTVAATADGLDVGSGFGSNVDSDAQAHCEGSLKPTVFPEHSWLVAGRGTKDYHDWWREQVVEQERLGLFTVRLIGDASSPQLFTPMAPTDLAYCRCACYFVPCGCFMILSIAEQRVSASVCSQQVGSQQSCRAASNTITHQPSASSAHQTRCCGTSCCWHT